MDSKGRETPPPTYDEACLPGVNFINIVHKDFTLVNPKSEKRY